MYALKILCIFLYALFDIFCSLYFVRTRLCVCECFYPFMLCILLGLITARCCLLLDWVLSHWAHFTVLDSFLYCVLLCVVTCMHDCLGL